MRLLTRLKVGINITQCITFSDMEEGLEALVTKLAEEGSPANTNPALSWYRPWIQQKGGVDNIV